MQISVGIQNLKTPLKIHRQRSNINIKINLKNKRVNYCSHQTHISPLWGSVRAWSRDMKTVLLRCVPWKAGHFRDQLSDCQIIEKSSATACHHHTHRRDNLKCHKTSGNCLHVAWFRFVLKGIMLHFSSSSDSEKCSECPSRNLLTDKAGFRSRDRKQHQ
jgi:hypothetical protein